jgi:soluble lytic murein transglycosylase-like protein
LAIAFLLLQLSCPRSCRKAQQRGRILFQRIFEVVHKRAFALLSAAMMALARVSAACAGESSPLSVARPATADDQSLPGARPQGEAAQVLDNVHARKLYWELIRREAAKSGLPPDIADAVAAVESGYNPAARGAADEVGLMQVRPETARMLGFTGDLADLALPEINIHYGVIYLSQAWRLTGGDLCRTFMKYRAGHGEEVMSPPSVIYCGRARAHLAAAGSPFADATSMPFAFVPPIPAKAGRAAKRGPPKIRTAAVSRAFWAAHDARIRALTKRIEAKWRHMAAR